MQTIKMSVMAIVLATAQLCSAGDSGHQDELTLDLGLQPAPQQTQPTSTGKRRRPRCLKKEPGVALVVRVAWEEAGLQAARDRSREGRVRAAGWLPRLTGGVSKDIGGRWDYRYEAGTSPVDQLQHSDGWRWDANLSWDLPRAIYNPDEINVAREAAKRAMDRMEIANMVVRLYFDRLRLLVRGLPLPGTPEALKLLEATASLNAWTAGRFSKNWCEVKP
ncbi:MAG TPA: hypothetical protein VM425_08965 [Myxococcota bacterium]|nr:hypothetical protein [Myxococcota bacterium]